MKQHFNI